LEALEMGLGHKGGQDSPKRLLKFENECDNLQ
jgi:hypothetical protein